MLGKRLLKWFINKRSITLVSFCILLFKFNTVLSQNVNFSLTSGDLGLIYQNEGDFEVERTIPSAVRLSIGYSRRDLQINAKCISTQNYSFSTISDQMYSLELSNTNATNLSNYYYQRFQLDLSDQTVVQHRRRGRNVFYEYDLIVNPVGFDYEPGQYFYSIIFTVSQD